MLRVKKSIRETMRDFAQNKVLLLMLLPAVIYFIVFAYLPMVGSVLAFKQYDFSAGIFGSRWVGFDNFKFFFQGENIFKSQAWRVTSNTVLYNAVFIIINNVLQITFAILLSEIVGKRFKKISQTLMLMPYFISWVVVSSFIYNLFNYEYGVLNTVLKALGMQSMDVLGTVGAWKYIIVFFNAWSSVGYWTIVYLAAIVSIDREMYEAAEIDGANIFRQIFSITLPCLKPTIITLLLLSVGGIFRGNFAMFYQIVGNNGLLFDSTDVIDTYVFRLLMNNPEFGMSAAVGLYQSVLCFTVLMLVNALIRKLDKDYALF